MLVLKITFTGVKFLYTIIQNIYPPILELIKKGNEWMTVYPYSHRHMERATWKRNAYNATYRLYRVNPWMYAYVKINHSVLPPALAFTILCSLFIDVYTTLKSNHYLRHIDKYCIVSKMHSLVRFTTSKLLDIEKMFPRYYM